MEEEQIEPTRQFGLIRITASFAAQWGLSIDACDTQGKLQNDGLFEKLHKILLMPESYKIRGIFFRWMSVRLWDIWVESEDLPEVEEYCSPSIVNPFYAKDDDGTVRLVRIEVEEGTSWKTNTSLQLLS